MASAASMDKLIALQKRRLEIYMVLEDLLDDISGASSQQNAARVETYKRDFETYVHALWRIDGEYDQRFKELNTDLIGSLDDLALPEGSR